MKKSELSKVAKELNELFGLDPAIDPKSPVDNLIEKIQEATALYETGDELSDETISIIGELDWNTYLEELDDEEKVETLQGALSSMGVEVILDDEDTDDEDTEDAEAEVVDDEDEVVEEAEVVEDDEEEEEEEVKPKAKPKAKKKAKEDAEEKPGKVDRQEPAKKASKDAKKAPAKKKESSGGNRMLEKSEVQKDIKVGDKVKFKSSPRSKGEGKELTGTIVWIKWDQGANNEYVQIENKKYGKFHKTTKSVEKQ